jgi:hypothetical protein
MSDQKSTDSGKNFLVFMYKFLFFYCDIPPIMKNHPLVFGRMVESYLFLFFRMATTIASTTTATAAIATIIGSNESSTGGSVAGGSVAGGSVTGGSVAGGSVAGGSVTGGSVAGGSVTGGSVAGGSVAGGSVAGGSLSTHPANTAPQPNSKLISSIHDTSRIPVFLRICAILISVQNGLVSVYHTYQAKSIVVYI